MSLITKKRAILFADISGSTALYELLGDKPATRAIENCFGQLREVVAKLQGQVVKTIGDEIMVVFGKPEAACEAAMEMQHRMAALPPVAGVKLAIRVGFHFGPVLEKAGDYLGDGVNIASRLTGLAKGGQILTSGATAESLPSAQQNHLRDLAALPMKGKQAAIRVFELLWGDADDVTLMETLASSARIEVSLTLELGRRRVRFPADKATLSLGRDRDCDLIVREKTASRRHARIERSGAQYVLVDESTNGTYVFIEGDREVMLRRDSVMLRGRGKIALGTSTGTAVELVLFDCS
jgi:class 3 adenylate cyclase